MRHLTIVMPYYLNPTMLFRQIVHYASLSETLRKQLTVIVVDDGTPKLKHRAAAADGVPFDLRIFRIDVDIRWNQDEARNIGMKEAPEGWVIMTDIDHVVSIEALRVAIKGPLQRGAAYRFGRVTATGIEGIVTPYKPHPNSFLLERETFEKAGGYDERFAGFYGTDADFVERLVKVAPIMSLKEPLIRFPREVIPDASTVTYKRKTEEDGVNIRRIKKERKALGDWKPLRYRNEYFQVYP